jgi:hypothetical protein
VCERDEKEIRYWRRGTGRRGAVVMGIENKGLLAYLSSSSAL